MRVPMANLMFRSYTGSFGDSPMQSWEELCHLRRYFVMHVLYNGLRPPMLVDSAPITLTTAQAPELLLDLIRRVNDGEFAKMPRYKEYPVCFIAVEVLSFFVHRHCIANSIIMEKFFRDIPGFPQEIIRTMDAQSWLASFSAVRMFGFASLHPTGCVWFLKHPKALTKILNFLHSMSEFIERHAQLEEKVNVERCLKVLFDSASKENFVKIKDIIAVYTTCVASLLFGNMMHHFRANFEDFRILRSAVYDAEILQHFFVISRSLMRWLTPGRFMSKFLQGVCRCMEMDQAAKFLFLDDFEYCRNHKISTKWDCLKYFNHPTLRPCHVTFLLCHALSAKYLIGANWAMAIIVYTLQNCSDEVCQAIIEVSFH